MLKRITALLLAAMMLFSLFSCKKNDDEIKTPDNEEINSLPIMATENYEVTVSMMTYFLNSYYRSFVSNNQLYLGQLGLDPSRELSEQKYSEEYTWLDYFLFYLSNTLKQQLVLAEAAKAEGFELTQKDLEEIDKQISYIDEKAVAGGNTTTFLIQNTYGKCVNEHTIRKCLQLTTLSMKYSSHLMSSYSFSDDEIEKHFEENAKDILSFSYIRYQAKAEDSDKVMADFSSCTTEEEFVNMIKKYAAEAVYDADDEYMANLMKECYVYGVGYSEDSKFADWAFADGRKAYEVYTEKTEDGKILAAMALPASEKAYSEVLWRDITPVHNIESIYFAESVYKTEEAAKSKAEEVFATLNAESDFSALIKEYDGGTTSNLIKGGSADVIENWVFDESRQTGDIGLVTVEDTGTYIIRLKEDGMPAWKYFTLESLSDKTFNDFIKEWEAKAEIKKNNDAISQITPITLIQ
ncbi:MAG: peptidylprolyl isomerase [Clostridia bacterium]|nr:peptidylprolyl isomerase [Clostridia bacterium]